MANATSIAAPVSGGFFAAALARLRQALQQRRVYNQTMRELSALTTRELTDLGITRSMITRLALEAAYGKGAK